VEQAIAAARQKIAHDDHSEQLHVIPSGYSIDGVSGIPNPVGMVGFELAVDTCVVTAPLAVTQNLVRTLSAAGVEPDNLIAAPLAAAESVRGQGEPGLPLAVVDIGAQTTGFTLYAENAVWQCDSLPIGGGNITREIAHTLRLPIEVAEELKLNYTTCLRSNVSEDDLIEMEPLSGEDELLPATLLAECAAQGAQELAAALLAPLQRAQRQRLSPAKILLTGGGAELHGLDMLLASQLRIPVMVGRPAGVMGAPPMLARPAFAVATGLLLLGARRRLRATPRPRSNSAPFVDELRRLFGRSDHRAAPPPRR
jgi:cell division protein FtsA